MENQNKTGQVDLSEVEMLRLINLSECAMFITAPEAELQVWYANKKFYELVQYTPEEFKEQFENHVMGLIVPEEKQNVRNLIARQLAMGGVIQLECRVRRKDGGFLWISLSAEIVRESGKRIYYCSAINTTKQKRNMDEVYKAKNETSLIVNNILGGVIKLRTKDFALLYANEGFFKLAGYSRAEYLSEFGNVCSKVIHPDDQVMVAKQIRSALDNHGNIGFEYRIINRFGETRWSYVNGCQIEDVEDSPVFLCIIMDITERKKLDIKLDEYIRCACEIQIMQKSVSWLYYINEERVVRTGDLEHSYSQDAEIYHFFTEEWLNKIVHPEDVPRLLKDMQTRMKQLGKSSSVYLMQDGMGDYRPTRVDMISACVNSKDGVPDQIYGQTHILTEEEDKELTSAKLDTENVTVGQENRLVFMAENAISVQEDVITHMMSYQDFLKKMSKYLKEEPEKNFGVLCCDINEFSKLNYHYGVSFGNQTLRSFGGILRANLAYEDMCSRIRGDYFVVFFSYENHNAILKELSAIQREIKKVAEDFTYVTYGTTMGALLIEDRSEDIVEMIAKADIARRSIKGMKGNHFALYTDDLQKMQFCEDEIIEDISDAIKNHTVEICYQPRFRDEKDNIIGCKVVPQVQRRTGEFLPLEDLRRYTDRTQDVQELVFYVLSNVCRTQGVWKAQGKKVMPISLDITQGQLCQQNAVERIQRIVEENGMDPFEIIFEIQEQYFREMTPKFQMALEELHRKGYRLIISRFGSDHTAVEEVRRLPIYAIKFHGEYFHENTTNEKEMQIFKSIVKMAQDLGMKTSCGGIHTERQEEIARSIGCNIFEGDLYYGTVRNDVYARCFLEQ